LENYQVFQKNINGSGGGLLTAVDPSLNPMLISARNEEAEILTVQLKLNTLKLRVINGYGPQNDDTTQNKLNFWMGLEEEIIAAKSESCMILIQMDANAKVGRKIISLDPNSETDGNGKLLLELINRHGLVLLNVDRSCTGVITRQRITKTNTELAILDYMLVCQELYQFFVKMEIDDSRKYTLTKYATSKGVKSKVLSDHNPMFAKFNIKYEKLRESAPRR
jgi:exonuclease III